MVSLTLPIDTVPWIDATMSTDFDLVCVTCQERHHIGQRFSSGWSFGYGSKDEAGQKDVGQFIIKHAGAVHDVRVVHADATLVKAPHPNALIGVVVRGDVNPNRMGKGEVAIRNEVLKIIRSGQKVSAIDIANTLGYSKNHTYMIIRRMRAEAPLTKWLHKKAPWEE